MTAPRVALIRDRAGIPAQHLVWTEAERTFVIAHQDRSARAARYRMLDFSQRFTIKGDLSCTQFD